MSYLVLARKYRPQTFADVVGQEHVTRVLRNAIIKGRIPHALIFSGPRGVGKTTSARVLAKALNCTGRTIPSLEEISSGKRSADEVEPCGECPNCTQITKGSNLAVQEIDGASNNSVENVRQLIDSIHTLAPENITFKIYIIDEVHMLTTAAFNALLKTLEEPPPNTIFIFATTEPHKIPDTVLSRCQQYDFRRISISAIVSQLKSVSEKEAFEVDDDVLQLIARICQGGMRDANSLLDRVCSFEQGRVTIDHASKMLGVYDLSHFGKIIDAILEERIMDGISLVQSAFSSSVDVKAYINDFVRAFRLLSLYKLAEERNATNRFVELEELSDVEVEVISSLSQNLTSDAANRLFSQAMKIAEQALQGSFPQYVLESGIVELSQVGSLISLSEVLQNLEGVNVSSGDVLKKKAKQQPTTSKLALDREEAPEENPAHIKGLEQEPKVQKEEPPEDRDLVWLDFLSFLKSVGELRLETFLRRVAPVRFTISSGAGLLHFAAQEFLAQSFSDGETQAELKKRLVDFSHISTWNINIDIHADLEVPETSSQATRRSSHVPGSAEEVNQRKKLKKVKLVQQEASEDDFVKEALSVFDGSVIEKIVPVKRA